MPIIPIPEIANRYDFLINIRKEFHRKPELAFAETNTAASIVTLLKQFGFTEIHTAVAHTGVVAILRNGEGPTIAFRADLDALPVTEKCDHDYSSENDGKMHACGHDGHMTMLLGAAEYLSASKNFKGTIVFIFQPAEEQGAGAKLMLQQAPLNTLHLDGIFAMHNLPGLAVGEMVVTAGPVMAAVNEFQLTIIGNGCHAAMPHLGKNPIIAAAALTLAIEQQKSQWFSAFEPVVISTTVFQAGEVFNVIPGEAKIKGTVRYLNPDKNEKIPSLLKTLAEKICNAYEVQCKFDYFKHCPATVNHAVATKFVENVLHQYHSNSLNKFEQKPVMISEDFSYFLEKIPGVYAFIGNGESKSLHHPSYRFDDANLILGASFYAYLARHADILLHAKT